MRRVWMRTCARAAAVVIAMSVAMSSIAMAQTFETSAGPIVVTRVAGPFEHPWAVAFLPDGRQLVTERDGRLLLVTDGAAREVAGMPEIREFGQGGLLDVILDPAFAANGRIYFTFSDVIESGLFSGRQRTAVARATLSAADAPSVSDVEIIFGQEPALDGRRHFGSRIVIMDDGTLMVTTGDRGERPLAQDLDNHVGKVVRIQPDGGVPDDNPFLGQDGVLPELWSYGHRNPQGAARRPSDGSYWLVEHGAAGGDEINKPLAGLNYGWPVISYGEHYFGGTIGVGTEAPGMEQPVYYWDPSIAPSGLAFYDGDLIPDWRGDLFVGALKFQLISRLEMEGDSVVGEEQLFEGEFGRIRDVRSGPDGALWFLTDEDEGALYRAAPPGQ